MVKGIESFKRFFAGDEDKYVLMNLLTKVRY